MTVKSTIPGVDVDVYCYETGLSFGMDFGREMLSAVLVDEGRFPKRVNYNKGNDPKQLARLVGADKTRELIRRQRQVLDKFPNQQPIEFKQYFFDQEYSDKLNKELPDFLTSISPGEPKPILQVSENGEVLPVHKGHKRKCSLMMLLQSDEQETRWYRDTEYFEVIDPLRIPDLDKIEKVAEVTMKPYTWYMFNHFEWHSVHKFTEGSKRISIGIDFYNIDAVQLLAELKSRGF